jgi:hypothetical protein
MGRITYAVIAPCKSVTTDPTVKMVFQKKKLIVKNRARTRAVHLIIEAVL